MARAKSRFVCQTCGTVHPRWTGKCDGCGGWNTITEEQVSDGRPRSVSSGGRRIEIASLAGAAQVTERLISGIGEFDRVTGGGLVPGSAVLIGGDPGIGKSTLLLQVTAALTSAGETLYVSGEEAIDQIRLRATRMGVADAPVSLATTTNVRDIVATLDAKDAPVVAVIDSIQTMYADTLDAAPGTVSQVRAAAQELIRAAKRRGTALLLVGHVTKDGTIAGPRVLEHMVDTVLYFEGERSHQFRILRAVKNRFGATDEIGVFEMSDRGLMPVANPSALFLGAREGRESAAGSAVFAGMEGTRPLLVEIQALVAPSAFATPRRAVVGWDNRPPAHDPGRARDPVRGCPCRTRRIPERGRWAAGGRARGRPGGGDGSLVVAFRQAGAPGIGSLWRGRPLRRGSRRQPDGQPAQGSRQTGLRTRRAAPPPQG